MHLYSVLVSFPPVSALNSGNNTFLLSESVGQPPCNCYFINDITRNNVTPPLYVCIHCNQSSLLSDHVTLNGTSRPAALCLLSSQYAIHIESFSSGSLANFRLSKNISIHRLINLTFTPQSAALTCISRPSSEQTFALLRLHCLTAMIKYLPISL
jgi:hypothetical protein